MPITDWLHYADHDLDPICRSASGSIRPVTDTGLPNSLSETEQQAIFDSAKPLIRVELTLRMPALNSRKPEFDSEHAALRQSSGWSVKIARHLLENALARYKFNGHIRARLDPNEIERMKPNDRTFYLLQQSGVNLAEFMTPRNFKNLRTKLLQRYQIDIARPASDEPASELFLAELLAPEKLLMNWPKKLRRMGLIAGTDEWK